MSIPRCTCCCKQFTKDQLNDSMWSITYKTITCTECETVHSPTIPSRLAFGLLTNWPILFFQFLIKYMGAYLFLFYLIWMIVMLFNLKHILRYKAIR